MNDIIELFRELQENLKEIEKKFNSLNKLVAKEQNEYIKQDNTKNTLAYQLFGKQKKDLTKEELKDYTRIAVAKAREIKEIE